MNASLERRIAEIERMLAETVPEPAGPRRDLFKMSAAECVEEWHRLCQSSGGWRRRPYPPDVEAWIIAKWRALS